MENNKNLHTTINGEKIDLSSGKYTKIWHGPQHPGITGNMSVELTMEGDVIVDAKTHVGYLHRGFEKLMERRRYIQCFPIVCRMCVPESDFNEYCFATGTESLANLEVPERALWHRALVLEMARLVTFVRAMAGAGGSIGMGVVGQWMYTMREYLLDLFEELTGGRVYHMYIIPGGVRRPIEPGFEKRMEDTLKKIEETMKDVERILFNNSVFKSRTIGAGIVKKEWIEPYGVVGPNAKAAGFARDVRKDNPYLIYDKLDFEVFTLQESDIYARTVVRKYELYQSIDLIRQILAKMPKKGDFMAKVPNVLHWKIPKGETFVRAESSRGEFGFYMVSDGSAYPRRVNLRGPSYTHAMALLPKVLIGSPISEIAPTMVSLATCPPEIER